MSLYEGCENSTAAAVDRVYRLLDTAFYGRIYTLQALPNGDTKPVPDIPELPDLNAGEWKSLVFDTNQLMRATVNFTQGDVVEDYNDTRNPRQQLEDILAALQAGEQPDQQEIINLLGLILGAL